MKLRDQDEGQGDDGTDDIAGDHDLSPVEATRACLDRIEELRQTEVAQLHAGSTGHLGPTASTRSVAEVAAETRHRWLFGTPDEVVDQLHVYRDLGVSHFMLWFLDAPDPAGVRLFAEKVRPALG